MRSEKESFGKGYYLQVFTLNHNGHCANGQVPSLPLNFSPFLTVARAQSSYSYLQGGATGFDNGNGEAPKPG